MTVTPTQSALSRLPGLMLAVGFAAVALAQDEVPPTLSAATVSGRVLTLAWNETLGDASGLSGADYSVTVDGAARTVASVTVSDADVILTLSSPVGIGATVLISDASGSSSISDTAGNVPDALSDEPVKVLVNIVFFLADDHATNAVSSYGSTLISTPNIDRLARDGVRFDRALAPNSICQPARATLLTGKYAHRHGVTMNGARFDGSQQQVQHLLRKAGFKTAMIGKWHLESDPRGFDHWEILLGQGLYFSAPFKTGRGTSEREAGYTTDNITNRAIRWMRANRSAKQPFMALVWHKAPHRPWDPSPADGNRFADVQYPVPATFFDSYAGRASPLWQQQMRVDTHLDADDLKLPVPAGDARTTAVWKLRTYLRDYLRVVHRLDHNVGRVLDYLEASGLDESTLVVYASDQGFFLGEHGWFDKRWFHEESIRFPLIVRPPARGSTGSTVSHIVSQTDIAPTLLETADVDVPTDMQGRSLLPFLEDSPPDDWRTSFYYHYLGCPDVHRVARHRAVITERYKLVHYYQSDEWELFDRDVDPQETDNVHADAGYADQVAELKTELARLRTSLGDVDGPVAGSAPEFLEGATARRSFPEDSAGADIGAVFRVRAQGPPAYTLAGDDADSFGIVACNGQLVTKPGVSYDHESKSEYAVTVKVTDTWGRSDGIEVVVAVTPSGPPGDTGGGNTGGGNTGGGNTGGGGGGFGGGGARNQPPEATADIAEQVLDVGAEAQLDLSDHFRDPEGRDMTFVAESTDTAIATVTVTDGALAVVGVAHGATTATVTARDHRGLTATQTFDVTVGWTLGFATAEGTAAEGDSATLTIALNRVRETDTTVAYVVGADTDPATADADAADHDATDGMLTIAAGALEATLAIAVHDDTDIEPAREWFTLTLQPSATDPPPWGLGTAAAHVAVAEGVCDRTRQVRNALRRSLPCDAVDDADLAAVRTLDVSGTGLETIQAADLLQLDGLLRLDLSDNLLTALPAGLFVDLGNLVEVQAHDNPGAPFALGLTLHRINGAPWAPGPAHIVLRVREGAPFEFQANVTATAGRPSRERVRVAAGRDDHWRFWVWREGRGITRVSATPTDVPATRCGAPSDDYPCFQGLTLPAPEPLALFKRPPRLTGDPPEPEVGTSGDSVRIDLGKLFRGAERDEPLTCAATVRDADLLTATLDDCVLTLRSSDDGDDGTTTVTLTVTDADGQTTTLTFEVEVTPLPRGLLRGVRRVILLAPDDD